VNNVTVIKQTNVIYQGLPADCRYRGQRTTTVVNVPAAQRVTALESRPVRSDWRVTQVRTAPVPGAPPAERWQPRPEARAQIRRQVTVPSVPVRAGGQERPTVIRHPGGEEPRREERSAPHGERPATTGEPRRGASDEGGPPPTAGPKVNPSGRGDDNSRSRTGGTDASSDRDHQPRGNTSDDHSRDPRWGGRDSGSAGNRPAGSDARGSSRDGANRSRDNAVRARGERRGSKERRDDKDKDKDKDGKRREDDGR
jgi:hypothetical protein